MYCHKTSTLPAKYNSNDDASAKVISELATLRLKHYSTTVNENDKDFNQGFESGFDTALLYLSKYHAQIGFKRQLAHTHSKRKNYSYEKGFTSALYFVDQVVNEFVADLY